VVSTTPVADTPAPQPQHTIYLIRSGDTVTSIAAAFGVSIQAVLDANGVNRSSIIYAGRTLNIPGATTVPAGLGTPVTPLTTEMATNARTIIAVGSSLGVSDYGLVIALAAAMQESSLRNLNYGDLDSLGLFQQRPSTGWGTPAQVTDPVYASRLFFGGPNNPNKGYTRGLLDIPGWQSMSVTRAAQAVQISGHPNAYAKWEASARAWLSQLR
jgi:LysM repeat protein